MKCHRYHNKSDAKKKTTLNILVYEYLDCVTNDDSAIKGFTTRPELTANRNKHARNTHEMNSSNYINLMSIFSSISNCFSEFSIKYENEKMKLISLFANHFYIQNS